MTSPKQIIITAALLIGCNQIYIKSIQYPNTKKDLGITDTYFSTTVSDPYRWLEDDNSEETAKWVKDQNKITFEYLDNIPRRNLIKNRLTEIWDYEKVSAPFKRGEKYYYYNAFLLIFVFFIKA